MMLLQTGLIPLKNTTGKIRVGYWRRSQKDHAPHGALQQKVVFAPASVLGTDFSEIKTPLQREVNIWACKLIG